MDLILFVGNIVIFSLSESIFMPYLSIYLPLTLDHFNLFQHTILFLKNTIFLFLVTSISLTFTTLNMYLQCIYNFKQAPVVSIGRYLPTISIIGFKNLRFKHVAFVKLYTMLCGFTYSPELQERVSIRNNALHKVIKIHVVSSNHLLTNDLSTRYLSFNKNIIIVRYPLLLTAKLNQTQTPSVFT